MAITTPRSRSSILLPAALAATTLVSGIAGCGGGGGGDSGGVGASLAFTVAWEQPQPAPGSAASVAALGPDGAAASFDTPIPASVSAIRFILRPDSGPACCIAVLRGSDAFEERRIQLADVVPGTGSLEVHGYPANFAPNDGVTTTCATRDLPGSACSASQDTLPSFGSDEIGLDLAAGITNVVDVDVHSLPFLLDLDPADGATADDIRPRVNFAVVDAANDIDPDINIRIQRPPSTVQADILTSEECRDDDAELPDCSEGGALDVRGLIITSRSPENLSPGLADLRIRASNEAAIPRDMESNTTFFVPGDVTTTSSTLDTTTTTDTSTTTTLPPVTFCLEFAVAAQEDLVGVSYSVLYGSTGGEFEGSGEDVSCFSLLETDNTFTTFNDDEGSSTLLSAVISAEPFSVPIALAECRFLQSPPLDLENMVIQVTEATGSELNSVSATVSVTETTCPF